MRAHPSLAVRRKILLCVCLFQLCHILIYHLLLHPLIYLLHHHMVNVKPFWTLQFEVSWFSTMIAYRWIGSFSFSCINIHRNRIAQLETSAYYQNWRSVDEYIDEFKDLINPAGYSEGLAIVTKFCRGLQRDIQDLIVQLLMGCLDDERTGRMVWSCD